MASAGVVGLLRVLLALDTAQFEAGGKKAVSSAAALEKQLKTFGTSARNVGQSLTTSLTVPLVAAAAAAIKVAADFETSFANVKKTLGQVGASAQTSAAYYEDLNNFIRQTAREIPQTVNELARFAALGGQFGISAEGMKGFVKTMAALNVAVSDISGEEAAEGLAKLRNITQASEGDISRMAAALVALGNDGASTEGHILELSKRIASAGSLMGLTVPQIMGIAAGLANLGINAEAGGTAFSRTLAAMDVAADTGGASLQAFANIAGMSMDAFAKMVQERPMQAVEVFIQGLSKTREAGENLTVILGDLGVEGVRQMDVLRRVALASGEVSKAVDLSTKSYADNTAHIKAAEEKYKTFWNQLKLLGADLADIGIELGKTLLPLGKDLAASLRPGAEAVKSLVAEFNKLPQPVRNVAIGLLGLVAAAGPVIFFLGQVALAGAGVVGAFKAGGFLVTVAGWIKGVGLAALAAAPQILAFTVAAASVIKIGEAVRNAVGLYNDRIEQAGLAIAQNVSHQRAMADASRIAGREITNLDEALKILRKSAADSLADQKALAAAQLAAGAAASGAAKHSTEYSDQLKVVKAAVADLTPAQREQIDAGLALGKSEEEVAAKVRTTVDVLRLYKNEAKESTEATNALTAARKSLFGTEEIARANTYAEALGNVSNLSKLTAEKKEELHQAVTAGIAAYKALGQTAPAALHDIAAATLTVIEGTRALELSARSAFGGTVWALPTTVKDSSDTLADVYQSMRAMETVRFNTTWVPFVRGAQDSGRELSAVAAKLRDLKILGDSIAAGMQSVYQSLTGNLSHLIFGLGHDMDGALRRTAAQSTLVYQQIKADGTSTPDQISRAFEQMQRDIDAANSTFRDRFRSTWVSIKSAVFDVFDDILQYFVKRVVVGMIASLAGNQGAFGRAFSGFMSSAAGGAGSAAGSAVGGTGTGVGSGAAAGAGISTGAVVGGIGAAAGGYFAGKAAQSWLGPGYKAGGVGAAGGAAIGAAIGSVIPGLGTAAGAIIGGLAGFAAGFIGTAKEVKNARAEVQTFQTQLRSTLTDEQRIEAGGESWKETVIAVRDAYLSTGRTAADADAIVRQLWDTENPERAAEAMRVISGVMLEHNAILVEKQRLIENTKTAVDIFDEIMAAGSQGIPAAFQPAIDKLIELGLLTDEQADKLRNLPTVNVDAMESAMETLQGRIENMGQAFKQAKMNETAMVYANAIQTLIDGGADWGGVMMDAREEISQIVTDSIKFKTTIPANMKPWIDDLFASGNLLDENGKRITDISNIKYGERQKTQAEIAKEGWDKILAKIDQLIDKIANPLNQAIDHATRDRTINVGVNVDDPDRVLDREDRDQNRGGPRDREPLSVGTMGRFGKWFAQFSSRGTAATLHNNEAVITPGQAVPFAMDVLNGMMPSVSRGSISGASSAGQVNAAPAAPSMLFFTLPADVAGDSYRMTREVIRSIPSALEINEGNLRSGIERVVQDWLLTYGR